METIFDNDLRTLSDNELMYNITKKNIPDSNTFEDFIRTLTPKKLQFAMNVIELYKRSIVKYHEIKSVTCSNDIYMTIKPYLMGIKYEEIWVMFLNNSLKPIKIERLFKGGMTRSIIDIRIIMKELFLCNCTACVIIHNHPSNNIKPSNEDDKITEQIKSACNLCNIKLLDHLIYGDSHYYSYNDECRL